MILILTENPARAALLASALRAERHDFGFASKDHFILCTHGFMTTLLEPGMYRPEWKSWTLQGLPLIPSAYRRRRVDSWVPAFSFLDTLYPKLSAIQIVTGPEQDASLVAADALTFLPTTVPITYRACPSDSSLTLRHLLSSPESPFSFSDPQYLRPFVRRDVDWLIGTNFTRLATLYPAQADKLVVGRLQTTSLFFLMSQPGRTAPLRKAEAAFLAGMPHLSAGHSREAFASLVKNGLAVQNGRDLTVTPLGDLLTDRLVSFGLSPYFNYDSQLILEAEIKADPLAALKASEAFVASSISRVLSSFKPKARPRHPCPVCGSETIRSRHFVLCSDSCGFRVSRVIHGTLLSEDAIDLLLSGVQTPVMRFFPIGAEAFSASLLFKNKKLTFVSAKVVHAN